MDFSSGKCALIIVDVQRGFIREGITDHIPGMIARHLQKYGHNFTKIFLTQFINNPSSNFYKLLEWREMRDVPEIDLHPEVLAAASRLNHQIIKKETYGCSEISTHLNEEAVSSVIVCGIDTEACVMNIATELFDQGFDIRVWREGCASTAGVQMHCAALNIMRRTLGDSQIISSSA